MSMWLIVHVMRPIYVAVVANILPNPTVESVIVCWLYTSLVHWVEFIFSRMGSYCCCPTDSVVCMHLHFVFQSKYILIIRSIYTLIILVAIHSDEKDHRSS